MGIQGLLPLLKSIHKHTELSKYAGETLGIDAYGWLHRGTISCAIELAQGKPTRRYVDYAMHRVRMVKHFGVTPYLVFDGDFLPSKAGTEASRAKRREESKKAGLELLQAGKLSQAHQELQKAIDVTPEMARNLIEELKKADIPYVVAPYEADAQLVYLERQGIINGVISEDSDLLVFGCKRLLTKLDQYGKCIEINRRDFCAVREISLTGWTDAEFRHMAIFSGCDYLEGVGNMGLKTAYRMIRKHKTPEKVLRMLRFDGKFRVSENYLAAFKQAELTFLYQRVFCPEKQEMVFLTELDPTLDIANMPFIGAPLDPQLAKMIAAGEVNPITKELIVLAPALGRNSPKRRASQMATVTASAKPRGKPIDSYFKAPGRIPLGEMDPNCFVVEAGQVANLSQNGLLPRVFPLPRPYLDGSQPSPAQRSTATAPRFRRRVTEPLNNILSLPGDDGSAQSRRQTTGPLTTMSGSLDHGSSMRPPKKARLCEDLPSYPDQDESNRRSKFFSTKKPAPKRKSADTILFSDDLIEQALLELPDVDGWDRRKSMPVPSTTMQIYNDGAAKQALAPRISTVTSDIKDPAPSPSHPVKQDGALTQPTPSETPSKLGLQQFSYTPQVTKLPSSSGGVRMVHGLPTPASSMQKPALGRASLNRSFSDSPMLTPLQRIGSQALLRGKTAFTPPLSPKLSAAKTKDSSRRRSYTEMPVNPAFVPLPKVDVAEVEALNRACGSEDQIIPDSDEENDPDAVENDVAGNRLRLSRFLYS